MRENKEMTNIHRAWIREDKRIDKRKDRKKEGKKNQNNKEQCFRKPRNKRIDTKEIKV